MKVDGIDRESGIGAQLDLVSDDPGRIGVRPGEEDAPPVGRQRGAIRRLDQGRSRNG